MSSLILNEGHYVWHIQNGAEDISLSNLVTGSLYDSLYEDFTVGQVNARQLTLSLWDVDIDTDYPLVLSVDAVQADGSYVNYPKGTYLVDTVEKSPYSEYVEVTAYDAMLKADAPFMVTGTWAQTTDYAIIVDIASRLGVAIEANTDAMFSANPGTISDAPSIGEDGTTCREMLSYIGILWCGNWIINDNNELQFVEVQVTPRFAVQVDDDGLFQVVNYYDLDSTDELVMVDGNGDFQVVQKANLGALDSVVVYVDGQLEVGAGWLTFTDITPVEIEDEVRAFDASPVEIVDRAMVWANTSTYYRADSSLTDAQFFALTGKCVNVTLAIEADQTAADILYGSTLGYRYHPYTASGVFADPTLPLGTLLKIKDQFVYLTNRTTTIDLMSTCELSANATESQKSLYPKMTSTERQFAADIKESYARISVNEDSIESEVLRATDAEGQLSSLITQTEKDRSSSIWITGIWIQGIC